jgi:hypothetical protein
MLTIKIPKISEEFNEKYEIKKGTGYFFCRDCPFPQRFDLSNP